MGIRFSTRPPTRTIFRRCRGLVPVIKNPWVLGRGCAPAAGRQFPHRTTPRLPSQESKCRELVKMGADGKRPAVPRISRQKELSPLLARARPRTPRFATPARDSGHRELASGPAYGAGMTTWNSPPFTLRSSSCKTGMRGSGATEIAHSIPLSATNMPYFCSGVCAGKNRHMPTHLLRVDRHASR